MKKFIDTIKNIWKVEELRNRILLTLGLILIYRIGSFIILPGIDQAALSNGSNTGGLVGLLDLFAGGAFSKASIMALGIMPYISASIMMQLMTAVVPQLAKLSREEGGRTRINQYTRYITIAIALVQGFMIAKSLENPDSALYLSGIERFGKLVPDFGWSFVTIAVITLVAGTMLLAWIGDQITERGVGNGVSLIITVNIIAALPGALVQAWNTFVVAPDAGTFKPMILVALIAFLLFVIAAVIAITQAQRRIAVKYAQRVGKGRNTAAQTQTQYLPLKVNYAGVMPIIFASAILTFPTFFLTQFFKGQSWAMKTAELLGAASPWYYVIAGLMIFFFSYFWVSTFFNPTEIAENLKKSGGYIPGVRAGKPTSDFLDFTMTRLTFAGSIFLTIIFVMPMLLGNWLKIPYMVTQFFGGTSLLILVGVILDMMRQVETHLIQQNYDGFLRKGKIKGRYDRLQQQRGANSSNGSLVTYLRAFIAFIVVIAIAAYINSGLGA